MTTKHPAMTYERLTDSVADKIVLGTAREMTPRQIGADVAAHLLTTHYLIPKTWDWQTIMRHIQVERQERP